MQGAHVGFHLLYSISASGQHCLCEHTAFSTADVNAEQNGSHVSATVMEFCSEGIGMHLHDCPEEVVTYVTYHLLTTSWSKSRPSSSTQGSLLRLSALHRLRSML